MMLFEFDCRFSAEAYPRNGETVVDVLVRGDFQNGSGQLLRWRTYELDENGNRHNFGGWNELDKPVELMKFYE